MHKIDQLPPLRDVITRYDLMARKSLGQHFLCDPSITRHIVQLAGDLEDCTVFESKAKHIIALEKDTRCIKALQDVVAASDGRLEVREADAMKIDCTQLTPAPRALVANLPYNIGTDLLLGWLHKANDYRSMTLMFQKEVAERLVAKPDSKAYGRLSIITQFCCDARILMTLPAGAFSPPPKVDSAVVHLTPRKDRPVDVDLGKLERVTALAFGQRRKMLRSSLKPLGGEAWLTQMGIAPDLRAENL